MRIREGVTASVNASMEAVQADTLREDGLMLRTCEHGVKHPVGHCADRFSYNERDHEATTDSPLRIPRACCEHHCCENWRD